MPTATPPLAPSLSARVFGRAPGAPWLWYACIAAMIGVMLLPLMTLLVLAVVGNGAGFGHIAQTVLPRATWQTVLVLGGVGVVTLRRRHRVGVAGDDAPVSTTRCD